MENVSVLDKNISRDNEAIATEKRVIMDSKMREVNKVRLLSIDERRRLKFATVSMPLTLLDTYINTYITLLGRPGGANILF